MKKGERAGRRSPFKPSIDAVVYVSIEPTSSVALGWCVFAVATDVRPARPLVITYCSIRASTSLPTPGKTNTPYLD